MDVKEKTILVTNIIAILLQSPLVVDKVSALEVIATIEEMVKKGF